MSARTAEAPRQAATLGSSSNKTHDGDNSKWQAAASLLILTPAMHGPARISPTAVDQSLPNSNSRHRQQQQEQRQTPKDGPPSSHVGVNKKKIELCFLKVFPSRIRSRYSGVRGQEEPKSELFIFPRQGGKEVRRRMVPR